MTTLRHLHELYWAYLGQYVKKHLEYRMNFVIECCSYLLWVATDVALVLVVMLPVKALIGWTLPQLLFMYGLSMAGMGLYFVYGVNLLFLPGTYILEGQLDRLLLRPLNPYFQLMMERVSVEDLTTVCAGLGLVFWAGHELGLAPSLANLAWLAVAVIGSSLIYAGLLTATACASFWLKDRTGLMHVAIVVTSQMAGYPLSIYPRLLRVLLSAVIPIGFIGYYPAHFFFQPGAGSPGVLSFVIFLTPIVGVLTFLVGYGCWLLGLRAYESTGS